MARNTQRLTIAECIRAACCNCRDVVGVPAPCHEFGSAAYRRVLRAGQATALALTSGAPKGRHFCLFAERHIDLRRLSCLAIRPYIKQGYEVLHRPDMTRDPCFHRGCHPRRLMNPLKIRRCHRSWRRSEPVLLHLGDSCHDSGR